MKLINLAYVAASVLVPFVANATDLPSKKTAPALSTIVSSDSWTGAYAGVNAGYSFGSSDVTNTFLDQTFRIDGVDGFIGGIQIGYDYQVGSIVLGVAADYNMSSLEKEENITVPFPATGRVEANYVGTVRARLGYLITNNLLGYLTGGFAFSEYKLSVSAGEFVGSQSSKANGLVIGAGAEYRITKNLSTFAEYRYDKFDSVDFSDVIAKADFANNEIRFGVNYRF